MARRSRATKVQLGGDEGKASPGTNAQGRYERLQTDRNSFVMRAEDAAKVTIPTLFPPQGHNGSTLLPTPYQGIGARGLNNLASKLLLALMPPNAPFFRYVVDDQTLTHMTGQPGMRALVEKALGSVERSVMGKIENEAIRVPTFEALKQLIVSGNALAYLKPEGGMKVFRLDRYVVCRDTMGNLLEIVVREDVDRESLNAEQHAAIFGEDQAPDADSTSKDGNIALYTWIKLDQEAGMWMVHQEVNGKIVPESKGTYPKDKSPWLPLRWTNVDNEDYGRGYVEEYLGDLKSLEMLSKAIVEGSAAAAKVLFLVNPNGSTNAKQCAEAPNGGFRNGNAADVTVLQMQKYADFKVAKETISEITQRLSFAFLLNTSVQRNGERVTAEEIRFMASELEDALGGVYSILTQEFQLPLVKRLVFEMERAGKLPKLPHDLMTPTITTGLEALGRGQDMTRLQSFIQSLGTLGPLAPQALQYVNISDLITRLGTSMNIDMDGLIKPQQQVDAEKAQAQATQLGQNVAPHVVKGISDNIKNSANITAAQQAAAAASPEGQPDG
jgi:hypothetical protein